MPKRPNRNKRADAPHVRLYGWLLNSPVYLSLSCPARALLAEITRLYNGRNNGQIGLSVRRASERCNNARGTAQRAFAELQERGFVELLTKGAFSRKSPHASEWRLTFVACDVTGELASKAFMRWATKNKTRYQNIPSRYQIRATHRRESGRKRSHGAFESRYQSSTRNQS
jgi:hypothetical protein